MAKVEIRELVKEFDTVHGTEVAVDGVNLEIPDGEFVTLVGPSGCGKTTSLRCVAGLETPTSGQIILNGEDITDVPPNKRDIAMMFQSIALYPHMTVRENIAYPLKVRRVPKVERDEPVEQVAELMQITRMLDKYPGDLSGGQRQRAALARTVVQEPVAFLMDEPLSDLDAKLKVETRKEIQRITKKLDKPVLYVTHDQEEAMTMSDRIAVINDGRIEQIGTPEEIFLFPENQFVGQFIGSHGMNILDGTVVEFDRTSTTVSVDGSEFELEFEETLSSPPDEEVKIGFRPENTIVNESSGPGIIGGEVSLLESLGDEAIATISTPLGSLNAIVESGKDIAEEMAVSVSFDETRVHLFHPYTGETVAHTSDRVATTVSE